MYSGNLLRTAWSKIAYPDLQTSQRESANLCTVQIATEGFSPGHFGIIRMHLQGRHNDFLEKPVYKDTLCSPEETSSG